MIVAPLLSPDFVRKLPKWAPVLERDIKRIGRLLHAKWLPPELQPGRETVIAGTRAMLESACSRLAGSHIAADVETVGLGPTETSLVCFALSDGLLTVVVPWSLHTDGREPHWADGGRFAVACVNEVLARASCVTHNGPAFDHIVMARYGLMIGDWDDTLLAAHALEAHLPKNLAHVVTQYLDVPPWKQLEDRGADINRLHMYNARDTLYTALVWDYLRKALDNET